MILFLTGRNQRDFARNCIYQPTNQKKAKKKRKGRRKNVEKEGKEGEKVVVSSSEMSAASEISAFASTAGITGCRWTGDLSSLMYGYVIPTAKTELLPAKAHNLARVWSQLIRSYQRHRNTKNTHCINTTEIHAIVQIYIQYK